MSIIIHILCGVVGFVLGIACQPKITVIVNTLRTKLAEKIAPKS